jgi:hypothetical protein
MANGSTAGGFLGFMLGQRVSPPSYLFVATTGRAVTQSSDAQGVERIYASFQCISIGVSNRWIAPPDG